MMKMKYPRDVRDQIQTAEKADELMKIGGTATEPSVAHLKNDGNVTRQILEAVGHASLPAGPDQDSKGNR